MENFIQEDLAQEQQSEFHVQMLKDSRSLVDMSRQKMSSYYKIWDANDLTYRNQKAQTDQQDRDAQSRNEPEKMVVPTTYSQIQTFISFCYALFTQRERFFELLGMSEEDHKAAKIGEALLQRDLTKNQFPAKLYQFLLDIGKFGLGIFKTTWVHEKQRVKEAVKSPPKSFLGFTYGGGTTSVIEKDVTKFLGNRIYNISPYRFFPDTRLPICRFQEGEFVASEDEYSWVTLKQMESEGMVTGIDFIKPMDAKTLQARGGDNRFTSNVDSFKEPGSGGTMTSTGGQSLGTVVVTEVQRILIPSKYEVNGKPIGKEEFPVKYLIWYANDQRVIRCEPLDYPHDEFTYDLAEFNPDMHNLVNMALADTIEMLQSVISWFINSRISNVRRVISNFLVVDPEGIETKDLVDRKPVIRLKPSVGGRGIDRYIKQLEVRDVTTNHIGDAKFLKDLVQETTGISDNLLGQFHTGRRSATEARNVNSGVAARLKMLASIIFCSSLEKMGQKMLANLRVGLDEQTVVRVVGIEPAVAGASFIKASREDIAGTFDFEVFDGTLPSEKGFVAQVLQEVLNALISQPEAAIALGLDPKAMLMEVLELRGVRNPERFTLRTPQQQAGLAQNMAAGQQVAGSNGNGSPPSNNPSLNGGAGRTAATGPGSLVAPARFEGTTA